ncbi:MMPL family transporter [Nocardia sp. NPDC058480]|uniref:MMPL family transporter n=1 Tax=unclassified Nocardia TaxID=2637762 RepID=UPI003651ADC3
MGVQQHLQPGGFLSSDLESVKAAEYVYEHRRGISPSLVIMVSSDSGVDSASAIKAGKSIVNFAKGTAGTTGVTSYWTAASPDEARALRGRSGNDAVILATAKDDAAARSIKADIDAMSFTDTTIRIGGTYGFLIDASQVAGEDISRADRLAVPATLIVLIFVFGGVVAASLPILSGLCSIVITLGILRLSAELFEVSIFSLNVATVLGLALAIDYSLLIVTRYREERTRGLATEAAVVATMRAAGRTVLYSACIVGAGLAGLLVFTQFFLRSFAYVGLAVVLASALTSLILVPAVLLVIGDRIDKPNVRRLLPNSSLPFWSRLRKKPRLIELTKIAVRRPILSALVSIAALLAVCAPFISVNFGYPDDRVLAASIPSRQVGDIIREQFSVDSQSSVQIVLPTVLGHDDRLTKYSADISKIDGVKFVKANNTFFSDGLRMSGPMDPRVESGDAVLTVASAVDPYSDEGKKQLSDIRAVESPGPVLVGGFAAMNIDSVQSVGNRLPYAVLIMISVTLFLLFLFTGSVVLPLKAVVLNTLSLAAPFGALVWIFQEGHLASYLGVTATGYIDSMTPVLVFCITFGLSMDYEVFLLASFRREWMKSSRSPDDLANVIVSSVSASARVFVPAALVMSIVFMTLAMSRVEFLQLFGVGMTLAVLTDVTLIRMILAPALMMLMGTRNWWAPRFISEWHAQKYPESGDYRKLL